MKLTKKTKGAKQPSVCIMILIFALLALGKKAAWRKWWRLQVQIFQWVLWCLGGLLMNVENISSGNCALEYFCCLSASAALPQPSSPESTDEWKGTKHSPVDINSCYMIPVLCNRYILRERSVFFMPWLGIQTHSTQGLGNSHYTCTDFSGKRAICSHVCILTQCHIEKLCPYKLHPCF